MRLRPQSQRRLPTLARSHKMPSRSNLPSASPCARCKPQESTVDFENQCPGGVQTAGPCSSLFVSAGNAQNLNIATAVGTVIFHGGALLDHPPKLPADETLVYGTAGNSANIGVFP